jgi:hypothetical protein
MLTDRCPARCGGTGRQAARPAWARLGAAARSAVALMRCYRNHAEDDPILGTPIEPGTRVRPSTTKQRKALPPGLEPKTVVNTHRMLHRA